MSDDTDFIARFVKNRLRGDAAPRDLALLLEHREAVSERLLVDFDASPGWAPWLDTSYLTEEQLKDPDIRANIRAVGEVCAFIDFVAMDEDCNYFGYWRGPACLPLAEAPIACLDNEGQFRIAGTADLAGLLFTDGGAYDDLRAWFEGIGITALPKGRYDLADIRPTPSPRELHRELYDKYEREERGG